MKHGKQKGWMALNLLTLVALVVTMVGCPPQGHQEEELTGEIVINAAALYTLEEVEIEVWITNEHGESDMDMEEVVLEYSSVDSETWRGIELTAMTDHYVGTRTFASSGDYELRLSSAAHSGHELEEMDLVLVSVDRAHVDVGLYHIQFESTPGHIHTGHDGAAGDPAALDFWVALDDGGAPATGLAAEIIVVESDGVTTTLAATEVEAGLYSAELGFVAAGEAQVSISFTGSDSSAVQADFTVNIAAQH